MARSLRSQRVRKMKAIRWNVYYKAKELERLKTMVSKTKQRELAEIAVVVKAETLMSNIESQETGTIEGNVVSNTDVDTKKQKKYKKNMKDENGQYPIWLHPRKIRKIEGRSYNKKIIRGRHGKTKNGKSKRRTYKH